MKVTQKVRYGLECLFELAKQPTEYMDAENLATRRGIPPAYAQKVLQTLAHAGLLYSQKGVGYRITRPLQDITALEVITALSTDEPRDAAGAGRMLERRINDTLARVTLDVLVAA
jgi:Rrf2 family protein